MSPASANPEASPVVDPRPHPTEADHFVIRQGWRVLSRLVFDTEERWDPIAGEIRPEGYNCLHSDASDEDIDARIGL